MDKPHPERDFNFFMNSDKEYEQGRQNLENKGIILFFLCKMPEKDAFNKWSILNWEAKGISILTKLVHGSQI
jgi:hypothetical protein